MTTIKTTLIALATALPVLAFSLPSQSANSSHVETALVNLCKAAKSNKIYNLKSTMKAYGLQDKTVAEKVMCNGDDIITFSEKHGATKTAAKLQQSIESSLPIAIASNKDQVNSAETIYIDSKKRF